MYHKMGVLDQIMQMKSQGISDEQIVYELSQRGISPRDINDALKQAQIKNAVSNYGEGDLQPSIMPEREIPAPSQQSQPYTPEYYSKTNGQEYAQPQEETYQPQQQEQYYAPETGGYAPSGIDTDTVMEIADQIFSEKIKKIQKQTDATSEAAILLQAKTETISERLKKIEAMIDKLQIAILEKVGSYGQNLENIKKEMSMMSDSFSKMISSPKEKEPVRQSERYSVPEEEKIESKQQISRKK